MDDLSSHINSTLMYYNLSNTSLSTDFKPYSERLETYLVPIVFAFIFVVGVLGNGTLVLIFINHKSMRNVPNIYILSLALGDLLVILTCVPFTSTVYTFESWPYGESICKISESTKDISVGVSVFTLTALSAD
ncbi:neuropeptide CCHamide-1 receptor-like, partial [Diaphorina citri]